MIDRDLNWFKSKRSVNTNAYVEIADTGRKIAMRNSKDTNGPILMWSRKAFIEDIKTSRIP